MLKILRRLFLNARRYDSHRPPIHDIELDVLLDQPILAETEARIPDPLERDEVSAALSALPPGFGEVAWLCDALELTIAEAADVLDVPAGTVASRLHRARRMLRERLAGVRDGKP